MQCLSNETEINRQRAFNEEIKIQNNTWPDNTILIWTKHN